MEGLYSRMSRLVAASLMVVVLGSLLFSVSLGSEGSAFAAEPAGRVEVPHVEIRNAAGQRIDPYGNTVTRRSPGNHTPIEWDLP